MQFGNTPIWIRGHVEQKKYFATIGLQRISDYYETSEEVDQLLQIGDYNILFNAITFIAKQVTELEVEKHLYKIQDGLTIEATKQ